MPPAGTSTEIESRLVVVSGRKEGWEVDAQGAGAGVSFAGDEDILKVGEVVVTQHGKCTKRH